MKKVLFFFALATLFTFSSCKKDPQPPKCFQIPTTKNVSSNLLGKKVTVEWSTTDGHGDTFESEVYQKETLTAGNAVFRINSVFDTQNILNYLNPLQPAITLVMSQSDPTQIFKITANFKGAGGVWNGALSDIGAIEASTETIVFSNGITSPTEDFVWMCVQVTIHE